MKNKEALRYIKIMSLVFIAMVLIIAVAAISVFIEQKIMNPTPPAMPVTAPPTFAWPTSDPEFLQCGNIIISYEFISEGRHLIAIKDLDNENGSYIMPLFKTRPEAINFMTNYFNWLKTYYRKTE